MKRSHTQKASIHKTSTKNAMTNTVKHTHKKLGKPVFSTSVLAFSCASLLALSACTGEGDSIRILDDGKTDTKTTKTTTDVTVHATMPLNNGSMSVYDLTNDKSLFTANYKKADVSGKKAEEITTADKGLSTAVSVEKADIPKSAVLLVKLGATDKNATYYDPVLNKNTAIPTDKPLLALANTSSSGTFSALNATPYTTLALYRALARTGWFFEHNTLPTDSQLAAHIKQHPAFVSQYNTATREAASSLNFVDLGLSPLENQAALVSLAVNDSNKNTVARSLYNWITTIANMKNYASAFPNTATAPYFTFAHDLAKDFYDGDIDGATLMGLGNNGSNLVSNPMLLANIANTDPNSSNDNIYDNQRGILIDYERKLHTQISGIINTLVSQSPSDKQAAVRQHLTSKVLADYDTTDETENAATQEKKRNDTKIKNATITYADYRAASSRNIAYTGMGNKTRAFGLVNGKNRVTNINSDDALILPLTLNSVIGKYTTTGCTLTIDTNGVVTLKTNGNTYQTLADREENDSIDRIGANNSQNYMLNVSSSDEAKTQRRFIQINVDNRKVTSVSTAIASSANSTALANPEASCRF